MALDYESSWVIWNRLIRTLKTGCLHGGSRWFAHCRYMARYYPGDHLRARTETAALQRTVRVFLPIVINLSIHEEQSNLAPWVLVFLSHRPRQAPTFEIHVKSKVLLSAALPPTTAKPMPIETAKRQPEGTDEFCYEAIPEGSPRRWHAWSILHSGGPCPK